jgi:hypothetical protein
MKTLALYFTLAFLIGGIMSTQAQQVNLLDTETEDANFESITVSRTWPLKGVWGRAGGSGGTTNTTVRTHNLTDSALLAGANPHWKTPYSYLFMYMRGSNKPNDYVWRKLSNLTPGQSYTVSFWYKTPLSTAVAASGHVKFGVVTDVADIQVWNIANPLSPVVEFGHIEPDGAAEIGSTLEHKLVKNKFTVPVGFSEVYVAWVRSIDGEQQIYLDNMSLVEGDYTAVNEVQAAKRISVYPNPAANTIWLGDNTKSWKEISIIDAQGKVIKKMSNVSNSIDVESLNPGLYLLKGISDEGVYQSSFIKK